MGEAGAALLLKSLKNNNTLIVLNIQGNHVTVETAEMICKSNIFIIYTYILFLISCKLF